MSQKDVVEATKTPLTKEVIKTKLIELGINRHSLLEVHTKLSSFGYIVNKEYDIIDALMDIITEGVIIVPAHTSEFGNPETWSNPAVPPSWVPIINSHRKPFDRTCIQPERVGRLPQAFLHYEGVRRTNHPTMSLSVLDKTGDVAWLEHDLDDRKGINPLGKLAKEDGDILFMGTDFTSCTSIHLTERFSKKAFSEVFETSRIDDAGHTENVTCTFVDYPEDIRITLKR